MFDCVIPAAGLSSRMSGKKLSTRFRDRPLIRHAVGNALAACKRVVVVLGHDSARLSGILHAAWPQNHDLVIVENPIYHRGMVSSIARGAREVRSPWFFVAPADMPFLSQDLYLMVGSEVEIDSGAPDAGTPESGVHAILPVCNGSPAHPTLIRTDMRDELDRLIASTEGELASMRRYLRDMVTVEKPVPFEGSVIDIDTPPAASRFAAWREP